jgi:hypothetical protein
MSAIPKLKLGNIECGGGWGLGEQFAKLPSHDAQRQQDPTMIFQQNRKQDQDRAHSSDDEGGPVEPVPGPAITTSPSAIHTIEYSGVEREDDDDTFVDHGSNVDLAPNVPAVAAPPTAAEDVDADELWEEGRLVSRVHCHEPIYGLVVVGGRTLWTAIGDDPLTLFELSGCDLSQQRSMNSIVGVRSMALVTLAASRSAPVSFKNVGSTSSKPALLSRSNSSNPNLNGSQGEVNLPSNSTEFLWCGLDRGRVAIVDLFFFTDCGVLLAHSGNTTVCGVWAAGTGRVWTAGEDHSLKLWDASMRKNIRLLKMSDCVADVCHVPQTQHVWVTIREARILIFNQDGQEVRLKGGVPYLKTKAKVHTMRAQAHSAKETVVWVAMDHEVAVYNAKTLEVLASISTISCRTMELTSQYAILVGHHHGSPSAVAGESEDQLIFVSVTDPRKPVVVRLGAPLGGISKVGLRCFSRSALAVAAHMDGNQRCLTVFTAEATEPLGAWGTDDRSSIPTQGQPQTTMAELGARASSGYRDASPAALRSTATPGQLNAVSTPHGSSAEGENTTRIIPTETGNSSNSIRVVGAVQQQGNSMSRAPDANLANAQTRWMMDPRMQSTFQELHEEVSEVSRALRVLRVQQPTHNDFYQLHGLCAQVASKLDANLPVQWPQDAAWSTSEGQLIATTIMRLVTAASEAKSATAVPTLDRLDSARPASVKVEAAPTAAAASPLELQMHRHLQTMMRSAEAQRIQLQETISSLQRQMAKIGEKNAALLRGTSQLDAALRFHQRTVLAAAASQGNEDDGDMPHDHFESSTQVLDSMSSISDIMESFHQLQDRIAGLLNARHHLQRANSVMMSARSMPPHDSVMQALARTPSGMSTGRDRLNRTPISLGAQRPPTPPPCPNASEASQIRLTPKRLFSALMNELSPVEAFSGGISSLLHRVEGSFCRLQDMPLEEHGGSLDVSPALHDMMEAEVMRALCRQETTCMIVEELISAVSDAQHDAQNDIDLPTPMKQLNKNGAHQQWVISMAGLDKEDLETAISHITSVSFDLDTAASQVRSSLVRRYTGAPASGARQAESLVKFGQLVDKVRPSSCRLRGLLAWSHVWLRCLALGLDEAQTILSGNRAGPVSARSCASVSITLPRHNVEFMLQQVMDWRAALLSMRQETEMYFHAISEAQRAAGGEWAGTQEIESSADLSRATLTSLCLLFSTRRSFVHGTTPPLLVEDASNRSVTNLDLRCDDLYGLLSEILENIGAVLQTKIDALTPVCQKIESVLSAALQSSQQSTPTDTEDEESETVTFTALNKLPLEEAHKQFCMTI